MFGAKLGTQLETMFGTRLGPQSCIPFGTQLISKFWIQNNMKKKYYHASKKLFKPGDVLTIGNDTNFRSSRQGFIYLTEKPEAHYTVAPKAFAENWYVYEVRPEFPKSVKYSSCWEEWITDKPCIVVKRLGSARGISKAGRPSKKESQKENDEWLKERIKEAKDVLKCEEKRAEWDEWWNIEPGKQIQQKQNELKFKNAKTSKATNRYPYRGL